MSDGIRDDLFRTRQQLAERTKEVALLSAELAVLRAERRTATIRFEQMANDLERLKLLLARPDQK